MRGLTFAGYSARVDAANFADCGVVPEALLAERNQGVAAFARAILPLPIATHRGLALLVALLALLRVGGRRSSVVLLVHIVVAVVICVRVLVGRRMFVFREAGVLHAEVLGIAVLRQILTEHALWPFEAVLLHDRLAALAGTFTYRTTHRQRLVVVFDADRRVHRAQEELQVLRAPYLDERPELVHFQTGLFLRLVVHLVRELGHVVADAAAHRDRDFFASWGARFLRGHRYVNLHVSTVVHASAHVAIISLFC